MQAQNTRSLPDDKTSFSSFAACGILQRLQSPLIASFFEVVAGHRVTWGFYDFKGVRAVCINPAVEMRPPQFFMTGMIIISTGQCKIPPTNSIAFHLLTEKHSSDYFESKSLTLDNAVNRSNHSILCHFLWLKHQSGADFKPMIWKFQVPLNFWIVFHLWLEYFSSSSILC